MKLQYDATTQSWTNSLRLLEKHDVVFRSPVCDPTYGLPIGDGDTGCLLWLTPESLHIQVNKTDLWDDSTANDGMTCPMEHENLNTCRHGAEIELNFGCPLFDCIYTKDFEARLSLTDASAHIRTETPFCTAGIRAFASHRTEVTVIEADAEFPEDLPVTVTLKRWGSRTFFFWYSAYKNTPERGLDGTTSASDERNLTITQQLNGNNFCVMLRALHSGQSNKTAGSHGAKGTLPDANHHKLTYLLTVATGETAAQAEQTARHRLDEAERHGVPALYEDHRRDWAEFWSKSFVSLPEAQDYLENLWYLNLYYANSEMRGAYPPHFCNGIWGFYHDFVPWNNFFHYNMQHALYPLDPAGHPELLETSHRFRRNQLERAKEYTSTVLGKHGAVFADVCDRYGHNAGINIHDNLTPLSQIALEMYRHVRYTGDTDFLRDSALPMLRAAGEFYLDLLTPGEDGRYHLHCTQGYEGSPKMDDSLTDLSMIRAIFPILIKELPAEEGAVYRDRLENLPSYTIVPMYEEELDENGCFLWGVGNGNPAKGKNVLSVGKNCGSGEWMRRTFGNIAHDYYGFPDTEMAAIFPSGNVGIKDRGTELYDLLYNSVSLHHTAEVPRNIPYADGTMEGGRYMCMGWCMEPIYLARMGMAKELEACLTQTVGAWLTYPQGFGTDGPHEVFWANNNLRWQKHTVRNTDTGEPSSAPAWNFRHFDYETLPILSTAITEMLLQSYDGTLRLFPAVTENTSVRFRLAAEGGFLVNATLENGAYEIFIESLRGEPLTFTLPEFCKKPIITCVQTGCTVEMTAETNGYHINVSAGNIVRIISEEGRLPKTDVFAYRNTDVKRLGQAKLGEERFF